ncbi:Plasmid replication initiator protein [Thermus arciformis]|uniref:Plasmid replication initiator protein n=1 Tax=Thermus arciformis TaxID=482827 RepID=A0A1G7LHK7_9DEIN|nr:replication initiator protein A [Thermus arciformis]SDF48490.1 Plasmid replication initiator protein [Thermus arciformis]
MASKKNPPKPALAKPRHFDEANVARLGLISIQERIPEGYASWEEEFEFLGKPVKLACYASEKVGGVPHGLDNEVSLALIALYFNAGSPEDGTFTATPYQILKLMGLDTSGYYYNALKESLMRLTTATYVLSEAWRENGRWQSVTFRYIEKLEYTSSPQGKLDRSSVLRITLAKEIVRSLKNQYVKPIDIEFMASLRRPLSRALYRLLDAQRFSPENPSPLPRFEVNLMEWAAACKIVHKRPDKVRRTLEPAHQELLERRYLQSVEYVGRGQNQTVVYVFGEEAGSVPDAEAVELLMAEGLSFTSAYSLARRYSLEHIRARVERFRAILASGYKPKNRLGFLVDVIRDESGKYAHALPSPNARRAQARLEEEEARRVEEEAEREWQSLPKDARVRRALQVAQLVLRSRVSVGELEDLARLMEEGVLDPKNLVEELKEASARGTLEDWLNSFRNRLEE